MQWLLTNLSRYLGGTAGHGSGHAISFKERLDSAGKPMYCAPVKKYRDGWNSGIHHDIVAIEFTDGGGWGGAVGLTQNGKPWQNLVRLSDGFTISGVLHEFGHVLGKTSSAKTADSGTDKYQAWRMNTTAMIAIPM
jgi:hypothetical protein